MHRVPSIFICCTVTYSSRIGLALRYKILGADRVQVQQLSRRKFWQDMREQGKLDVRPEPPPPAPSDD
jgi:hypothetical protein